MECGQGTFLFQSSDTDFECIPCPVGTYQNQEGQSSCINCPHEMVTYGKGASNITECFGECLKKVYIGGTNIKYTGVLHHSISIKLSILSIRCPPAT